MLCFYSNFGKNFTVYFLDPVYTCFGYTHIYIIKDIPRKLTKSSKHTLRQSMKPGTKIK